MGICLSVLSRLKHLNLFDRIPKLIEALGPLQMDAGEPSPATIILFRPKIIFRSGQYRVATVMEKSWNFEIFWNFWKSHGISPKIDEGHGKVMEFDKRILHIYKLIGHGIL